MDVQIFPDPKSLGQAAGAFAAEYLRNCLERQTRARLIVATGASQFETLAQLTSEKEIDWSRVDAFHLDEYVGLPSTHPASFCGYLRDRFVSKLSLGSFHYLDGLGDPDSVIRQASNALEAYPIDLALIGIGENGHLAFNDPPADFDTEASYHVVTLDRGCRMQQVGEGWFPSLEAVPERAFSMTVRAILRSRQIVCSVPDLRKAEAVRNALEGPLTPMVPASILRTHPSVAMMLDNASASLVARANRSC